MISKMKTAIIPTMPNRVEYLQKAVSSIIDQIDTFYIYLNDFSSVPGFLLDNDKIICIIGKDYGSASRFYISDKIKGYLFYLDDDIIYPEDYIEKSIAKIEQYERRAIITLHGRILKQPLHHWIVDQEIICRCLRDWPNDREIHVAGTGVMSYHSDTIEIKLSEFKNRNLDDVEFSIFAQEKNIPIIAVNHETGYLINQPRAGKDRTIWKETIANPEPLTILAQSINWKLTGIETNNKGIILKAQEQNQKEQISDEEMEALHTIRNNERQVWYRKMENLMQRRKERRKERVNLIKGPVNKYDSHVKKVNIGKKVLDIGCGSMIVKGYLSPDTEYTGIDAYPVNNNVVRMKIEKLSYPDLWFDTTIAFAVLDSVCHLDRALLQIGRVTKTNILILTGLNIKPNEFHTYMITEEILNTGLNQFRQGFKEFFGKNVALIEYVRF